MSRLTVRDLLFFTILLVGLLPTLVNAQVTSLSNSLATSDNSNVAPVSNTEIVSGEDSLIDSNSHPQDFDITGSSLLSGAMNPTVLSMVNPGQSQTTVMVNDALRAVVVNSSQSSKLNSQLKLSSLNNASSFSTVSPSTKQQDIKSIFQISETKPNANLLERSVDSKTNNDMPPNPDNNGKKDDGTAVKAPKQKMHGMTPFNSRVSGRSEISEASSSSSLSPDNVLSSPLERSSSDSLFEQNSNTQQDSIFRDLNSSSFLNTGLFSSDRSPSAHAFTTNHRTKQHAINHLMKAEDQESDGLTRSSRSRQKTTLERRTNQRPKWHNPILEQMEISSQTDSTSQ